MNKLSIIVAAALLAGTALGRVALAEYSGGVSLGGSRAGEGAGRALGGFSWQDPGADHYYGSPYGTQGPEHNYNPSTIGPGGTLGGGI